MPAIISSLEDTASGFYRGRAFISALADTSRMKNDGWKTRLEAAIAETGRSKRSISIAMGRGNGYVHSILGGGKTPTISNLIAVCEEIGASPAYILYGIDFEPEDAEIIAEMRADPETREAILALLRRGKPDAQG